MADQPDERKVAGYSALQITLHWIVVVLVAFQFVAHEAIESVWQAAETNTVSNRRIMAWMHVGSGTLILVSAMTRLILRQTRGAPGPPADEPRILKIASESVHVAIYVLLFALPLSGALAWQFGVEDAAYVHGLLSNGLLAAIALHVSGALFQHLVRRSLVMMRMFRPEST